MSEYSNIRLLLQELKAKHSAGVLENIESRRLFHGRGGCFYDLEHVCIDWFDPMLLLTLFADKGIEWEDSLIAALQETLPNARGIYIQRRYQARPQISLVVGAEPETGWFAHRGALRFELSTHQQNAGYFLDIEQGRHWLESKAKGASLLNLFSYTCTFSVIAVAAEAKSVVNMDLSSRSLSRGRDNHRINHLDPAGVSYYAHDVMKSWSKVRKHGPYDIVVCDPPSFQKGSFIAKRDYPKVLRRLPEFIRQGGEALVCLNSPEINFFEFKTVVDEQLSGCEFVERLPLHPDFPEKDSDCALKLLVYRKL